MKICMYIRYMSIDVCLYKCIIHLLIYVSLERIYKKRGRVVSSRRVDWMAERHWFGDILLFNLLKFESDGSK